MWIWGTENPKAYEEHIPDSLKVNNSCANNHEVVHGLLFSYGNNQQHKPGYVQIVAYTSDTQRFLFPTS